MLYKSEIGLQNEFIVKLEIECSQIFWKLIKIIEIET